MNFSICKTKMTKLKIMDLSYNNIDIVGGQALATMLNTNNTVECLY